MLSERSMRPRHPGTQTSTALRLLALVLALASLAGLVGCPDFASAPEPTSNCNLLPMTCTDCHGDPSRGDPAPPTDTAGRTAETEVTVGAHQAHLATSDWHRAVTCDECHQVPATVNAAGHLDGGEAELTWGSLATAEDATPIWDRATATCADVYCHGSTLLGAPAGGAVGRTPVWTQVDDRWDGCGTSCHTNPPGGSHPPGDACETCHGTVVASYDPASPATTLFEDASRHIDGLVDVGGASCTTCHGNAATGDPAPPLGTAGESATTDPAVGAHQAHLAASTWHRVVQCTDCHPLPGTVEHSNGLVDFSWGGPSNADGASSTYDAGATTCSGTYCHGTTLLGPSTGGVINRTPVWTLVDGAYSECGTTCHTNPPGGSHTASTQCQDCHGEVIAAYNAADPASSTWAAPGKHVDGIVQRSGYHDLGGWTSPGGGTDHHGSNYFLTHQQRDEHSVACTQCHGAGLDGGTSGVSCDNLGCHGRDWRSCDFCHGTFPGQYSPPAGVAGESTTGTLAVGRHAAHLAASSSHLAFDCGTCHALPATGDVSHALGYQPSADLSTTGHHGDVTLTGRATGMSWDVNATQGTPVTARGTCTGACHSNGDGGPPAVLPYWAGGTWSTGNCGNCHPALPTSGMHAFHRNHGLDCTDCHPGAGTATHPDGSKTYIGSATMTPNTCQANTSPTCNGICHGTEHVNDCWP